MAGDDELAGRKALLRFRVAAALPWLVDLCEKARAEGAGIVFHQDAFADDFSDKEILLLGMAVKFIGLYGIPVTFLPRRDGAVKLETPLLEQKAPEISTGQKIPWKTLQSTPPARRKGG